MSSPIARVISILIIVSLLNGCGDRDRNKIARQVPAPAAASADTSLPADHGAPKLEVDDYPVTDSMLGANDARRAIGDLTSLDKAWFSNDTLREALIFELYTDYHRSAIYHLNIDDAPDALLEAIELHTEEGEIADENLKRKHFSDVLASSTTIPSSCFRTNRGLTLGASKRTALKMYGTPDDISSSKGVEKIEWDFPGDLLPIDAAEANKPMAAGSYGHHVTMLFRHDTLIAMILRNDIP